MVTMFKTFTFMPNKHEVRSFIEFSSLKKVMLPIRVLLFWRYISKKFNCFYRVGENLYHSDSK